VEAVKNEGLGDILDKQGWESYYFINDGRGRLVGFVVEMFERGGKNAESTITGNSHIYLGNPYWQQNVQSFECDESFNTFKLEDQIKVLRSQGSITEVNLDKSGNVTVQSSDTERKVTLKAGEGSVPEYLIERIAVAASRGSEGTLVFNVIRNDGTKDVVVVSTKENSGGSSKMAVSGRTVEIHSPEHQYTTQILLDSADQIFEIVSQHQVIFILKRAAREDIMRQFGERIWGVPQQDEVREPEAI